MLSAVGLGVHKLSPARFRFNPSPKPRRTSAVDTATPTENPEPIAMDVDMKDTPVSAKKPSKEKKKKEKKKKPAKEEAKTGTVEVQPIAEDIPMVDGTAESQKDADANTAKEKKRKSSKKSSKSSSKSEKPAPKPEATKDKPIQPRPETEKPQPAPAAEKKKTKLPKLPENAKVTKRAIHHPPIPTPFSSAQEPKVVYITTGSPFIPQIKRIRALLSESSKRSKQSLASGKPGTLSSKKVDQAIADAAKAKGGVKQGEEVFVKATGKAIERALEIGLFFQQQADCKVRVTTGSVEVVDDVEIVRAARAGKKLRRSLAGGEKEELEEKEKNVVVDDDDQMDVDGEEKVVVEDGKGRKRAFQDVPETRIRTVSSIQVAISLV
jgi:ribonuclease P/MRP protein subunit POP7